MMKVAIISDVHGNLEALEAVWREIERQQVDAVDCLGDVIGYGADPKACLEQVNQRCRIKVSGNHEQLILQLARFSEANAWADAAFQWTRRQLTQQDLDIIGQWPVVKVGADARLVHGSPSDPGSFRYIWDRLDAEYQFGFFQEKICFFGHTHRPMAAEEVAPGTIRMDSITYPLPWTVGAVCQIDLSKKCRFLLNPGSVGQPRDGDPRARWALFQSDPMQISFHAVPYDIEKAQKKIRDACLPDFLADRIAEGK